MFVQVYPDIFYLWMDTRYLAQDHDAVVPGQSAQAPQQQHPEDQDGDRLPSMAHQFHVNDNSN